MNGVREAECCDKSCEIAEVGVRSYIMNCSCTGHELSCNVRSVGEDRLCERY